MREFSAWNGGGSLVSYGVAPSPHEARGNDRDNRERPLSPLKGGTPLQDKVITVTWK